MSSSSLRIGVVGAGYISESHLAALRRLPGVEPVAICDLSRGRAESLAARFGVSDVYLDIDAMLSRAKLDAVHVLTPPEVHEPIVKRILDARVDVLLEKPVASTHDASVRIAEHAKKTGRHVGVSHNFLFYEPYERLRHDVQSGRLGAIDQVDIVWNKELGQVKAGPHAGWLFERPENVLVEVGPHSLTQLLDLVGMPERLVTSVGDRVTLPTGRPFYRCWETLGWRGETSIRMRWSFIGGFPEYYIHVRGRSARAIVDFERNTYVRTDHSAQILDLDRFAISMSYAKQELQGGLTTIGRYLLGKVGLVEGGKIFADSIARAGGTFYEGLGAGSLDSRLSLELGIASVELAERIGKSAQLGDSIVSAAKPAETPASELGPVRDSRRAKNASAGRRVLVLGGTGFIGRALVKKLVEEGHFVRALVRDTRTPYPELALPGVERVRGDFTDTPTVERALDGVEAVYHLARGHGSKWEEYEKYDVEPTLRLARACAERGVSRFFYTSTIAIYWAGKRAGTITEETAPHSGVLRTALYARSKVAIERGLAEFGSSGQLEVVVFRPGVVIGRGGSPLHWGVGAWPYPSVCRLWGAGRHPLPFVLVDDCADAMVAALDVPGLHQQSFNLVGDALLTGHEYLDELEASAGIRVKRVEASPLELFGEEMAKWMIKSAGRDREARLPSWYDSDGRTLAARFDCSAAKNTFGWKPVADRDILIRDGIGVPVAEFLR